MHHSNNNLRFNVAAHPAKVSSQLHILGPSCGSQTHIDSIPSPQHPIVPCKRAMRELGVAYFGGRQNFPTKSRTLVASLSKAANWDDDVSSRTYGSARACLCCEKLRLAEDRSLR